MRGAGPVRTIGAVAASSARPTAGPCRREPAVLPAVGLVALVVSAMRRTPLRPGRWLAALVLCVVMAVSATWELFEWLSAVIGGSSADDFLGTQGDVWDTQWDMLMAGIGAITSLLLLSHLHDRQLRGPGHRSRALARPAQQVNAEARCDQKTDVRRRSAR